MTDLAPVVGSSRLINAANNLIGAGTSGEAFEIYDVLRKSGGKYYKSDSNGATQAEADCEAIALSRSENDGDSIAFGKPGLKIDLGISLTAGAGDYYVSNNAGKIAPFADLSSNNQQTRVGQVVDVGGENVLEFAPEMYNTPIP